MASCSTPQWSNAYTPQVRLDVNQTSSTATTATLTWTLYYVAHGYAASTGYVGKAYSAVVNGQTVASGNFNINGITGIVQIDTGTVTINKTTSSQNISFSCSMAFNITWHGVYGGTKSASGSIAVGAKTSYTITYNANGGSGAPGKQTKWAGTNITLSSTKPTRTGYSFQGWSTANDSSVEYAAGATYSANASVTLYAVWKANTYKVSYNANGGSGAPGAQTKTYGVTLKLSSTKPTRTNYNFKGWGTSASSTTVAYAAGANYTANAAITLYAIWELAYTKPRITNLSVERCTSNGTIDDTGTYAKVTFSWATDKTVTEIAIHVESTETSVTASGTSGSVSKVVGGSLSTENSYDISVKVSDASGSTWEYRTVSAMNYIMDFLAGGGGIAFGKPAELNGYADFGENIAVRYGKSIRLAYMEDPEAPVVYPIGHTNKSGEYAHISDSWGSSNFWLTTTIKGLLPYEPYGSDLGAWNQPYKNICGRWHDSITSTGSSCFRIYEPLDDGSYSLCGYIGYLNVYGRDMLYVRNDRDSLHGTYISTPIIPSGHSLCGINTSNGIISILSVSSNNHLTIGPGGTNFNLDQTNIYAGSFINFYASRSNGSANGMQMFKETASPWRTIFRPASNGAAYLGSNTYRWNTAFFTNQITASDLKEKAVIDDFDFKIENFIMGLKPIAYRRTGPEDTGTRIHMGFGAQDVDKLIRSLDLGNMSLTQAVIFKDVEVERKNDDGTTETVIEREESPYDGSPNVDDKDLAWSLNYNEFIAPIVLMLQKQQQEIANLKREIYILKGGN